MTLIEIFNDIEKLAKEIRGKLGYQPLDVRRKISSIANLAAVGRANVENEQANPADGFRTCPHCGRVDERVICQACGAHL